MFPKALTVALFSLYLSSFAVQALPKGIQNEENCGTVSVSTVFQTATVTVTAGGAASTGSSSSNSGSTGSSSSTGSSTGSSGNKGSTSSGNKGTGSTGKGSNTSGSSGSSSGSTGSSSGSKSGSTSTSTGKGSDNSSSGTGASTGNTGSSSSGSNTGSGSNSTGAGGNDGDAQTSLTLDPSVIATGFESDGQAVAEAGQVPSLTSSNNFINFCITVPDKPITNGLQVKTGSCNPAPMGVIAATTNMPSIKFQNPPNFGTIAANQPFTVQMEIHNLETGNFVNANTNYFSAPQQVNAQGNIKGHSHIVIEKLDSLTQTAVTNPGTFSFFKGVNQQADSNNVLTVDVTAGLPAGVYRLASINSAANHQPALVNIAQHGSLDDMIYFTVSDNAAAASNTTAAAGTNATAIAGTGAANATDAATGKNATGTANATDSASVSLSATGTASVSLSVTASVSDSASAASSTATGAGAKGAKGGKAIGGKGSAASASDSASSAAVTATASAADTATASAAGKAVGKDKASSTAAASSAAESSSAAATSSAKDAAATPGGAERKPIGAAKGQ